MRLFLAIGLSKELQEELSRLQHAIQGNLSRDDKLTMVKPESAHMTIKFFGEVEREKLDGLLEALRSVKLGSFSIEADKLNYYTAPNGRPRVVFLSFKKSKELTELHNSVESVLAPLGFAKNDFKCHVTLFRVRYLRDKFRLIELLKHVQVTPLKLEINSIDLFESQLLPDGPVHTLIERVGLR